LRIDATAADAIRALGDDLVRYDPRTGFHRAPAFRYIDLLARARQRGLAVDDDLAPGWQSWRAPRPPPPLRPYQQDALSAFETFGRRGIVALPTGSGKTHVACAAVARTGASTLVLVPTRVLLDQWLAVLRARLGESIGAVGDGMHRLARVTVMTYESAFRVLDRCAERFEMVVVDEAHHFAGGGRGETLEMCPAPFRLGLTATPPDAATEGALRLHALLGPVVYALGIGDLAGGALAPLEVVRVDVALSPEEREAYERDLSAFAALRHHVLRTQPDADWATCVRAVARIPGGREAIAGMQRAGALAAFPAAKADVVRALLARHRRDRTLLFTANADHAYAIGQDALVPVITADVSRPEREGILDAFRAGRVRAICSARVLNEGLDVPDANVAIVVGGVLGAREHVQRIGRILRPSPGTPDTPEKRAVAYELVTMDTVDEARTRARSRHLPSHAPHRASGRHVA
jgi:superfamily II DNA or RNA helicase